MASNLSNGFAVDLCSTNYEIALQELSAASAGLRVLFSLDETPASLADISVTVAGQKIQQDLYTGWTYDVNSNAIRFHGDAIPGPGETVSFEYTVATECQN